jgi:molybdate transport system substrate-binding protein
MMKWIVAFLVCTFYNLQHTSGQSHQLRVAVAANAQFVMKALQADFKKKTGINTEVIVGSSGNLSAQIRNGAPYDVFLSADMEFPAILFKQGLGITKPLEYALGSLVVCSTWNLEIAKWRSLLMQPIIGKIAVADPSLAPYGKAAEQALRHYGLWNKINSKLVLGQSISQVNTYITTGAVTLGFTTEALLYEYTGREKLKWTRVDKDVYEDIRQGFIVLAYARKGNYEAAMQFYKYLRSSPAKQILKQFGYQVP